MRSWFKLGGFLIITMILTRFIPFSAFFRNVNTLVHEVSHALITMLLSNKVMYIHLFADQSGVTYSTVTDHWMSIPISLAGYPGSALFTLLLFRLHAARREKTGLFLIAALATVGLTLFVRNEYGILWCIGFALITILIGLAAANWLRVGYYMLIAYLSLVESVISACTLVFLSFNDPAAAGDATNLAQATWVPAPVWAIAFALFALWCAKHSLASPRRNATVHVPPAIN